MNVIDNFVKVTGQFADDPTPDEGEIMLASEAAEMYPDFAAILTHPDFVALSWTIGNVQVSVVLEDFHSFSDGEESEYSESDADYFAAIWQGAP